MGGVGKENPNEIRRSISKSVAQHIIQARSDSDVSAFLSALARMAAKGILGTKVQGSNQVAELLANVLPDESKRDAFVQAIASFEGKDFRDFWSKHVPSLPEFRDKPELVQRVLLGQQITMLVGNHQPMVGELIEARKIGSVAELFELGENDWRDIVMKAGVQSRFRLIPRRKEPLSISIRFRQG